MIARKLCVAALAATVIVLYSAAAPALASPPHVPHPTWSSNPLPSQKTFIAGVHAVHGGPTAVQDAAGSNTLLDADVAIDASSSSGDQSTAAEGHLELKQTHGTTFKGSFFDNFSNKKYSASGKNLDTADENGIYTIKTGNGTFTSTVNGPTTTGTAPSKYGKNAKASLSYVAHLNDEYFDIKFATFGPAGPSIAGTSGELTLTTDGLNFIQPASKSRHIESKYVYTQGNSKHTSNVESWGEYEVDGNGLPNTLLLTLKISGKNFSFSWLDGQSDNAHYLIGLGVSNAKSPATYVEFLFQNPSQQAAPQ